MFDYDRNNCRPFYLLVLPINNRTIAPQSIYFLSLSIHVFIEFTIYECQIKKISISENLCILTIVRSFSFRPRSGSEFIQTVSGIVV